MIGLDPEFSENMERLKHPQAHKGMRKALEDVLGRVCEVKFKLLDASETLPGRHQGIVDGTGRKSFYGVGGTGSLLYCGP